ncbi:MAG: histidine phosphatase family protein, partial [Lachnospiraceae bacterium]|nr:histidine phosphatase family protein [Lachnospiraceae bacterium]
MELYVIRHGTTEWNKEHKLQGASDIPLDEDGRALAQEAAEGMKGIHFDRC